MSCHCLVCCSAYVRFSYSSGDAKPCGQADHFSADVLEIKIKAQKLLPTELKQAAEDAATHWTKDTVEDLWPAPTINAAASETGPPKVVTTTPPLAPVPNKNSFSVVEVPLKWRDNCCLGSRFLRASSLGLSTIRSMSFFLIRNERA